MSEGLRPHFVVESLHSMDVRADSEPEADNRMADFGPCFESDSYLRIIHSYNGCRRRLLVDSDIHIVNAGVRLRSETDCRRGWQDVGKCHLWLSCTGFDKVLILEENVPSVRLFREPNDADDPSIAPPVGVVHCGDAC